MKYNKCVKREQFYFIKYTGDNVKEFIEFCGEVVVSHYVVKDSVCNAVHITYYNAGDYEDVDVIVTPGMYAVKQDRYGRVHFYSETAFDFNFEVLE